MRGVVLAGPQKGRWVALKYLSTEGYSPDREVKLLRQLKHPNILELLEIVQPTKQRPQLVLVTPEADFDLRNYLGRSRGFPAASQGGNTRLSAEVVHCLATQLLAGISYLHAQRVVHRDLKPGNVLLTVVAPNLIHSPPSSLRLVLADFSRARILPSSWAPAASKSEPQKLDAGTSTSKGEPMMMTPGVSTVAYSAPEVLQARGRRCKGHDDDVCYYGTVVDVWAFGAIHFELMTLDVLFRGETTQDVLKSIAWRLGRQESQMDGMCAPLSTFAHLPGASLLQGALRWDPAERLAAETLWKQAQEALATQGPATAQQAVERREEKPPPALGATAAESQGAEATREQGAFEQQPISSSRGEERVAKALGGILPHRREKKALITTDKGCWCAGHCYQPGHRYNNGCDSYEVVEGSQYCPQCKCLSCERPRLRSCFCSAHSKVWNALQWPAQITHVMGFRADLSLRMMPCDIVDFLEQGEDLDFECLCTLMIMVWLKEPMALAFWKTTGVPGRALQVTKEELGKSLGDTIQQMDGAPNKSELAELASQGLLRL